MVQRNPPWEPFDARRYADNAEPRLSEGRPGQASLQLMKPGLLYGSEQYRGRAVRIVSALFLAALAVGATTKANAQFGGLFGKSFGFQEGEASGTYQSNNQIRTFISAKPYAPINLYEKVIIKAAEMTDAKNFARFGVTKVNCRTMLMNGSPMAQSCYVIAVMVNEGEQVKPRGKRQVQYYDVSEVQAGRIAPPSE